MSSADQKRDFAQNAMNGSILQIKTSRGNPAHLETDMKNTLNTNPTSQIKIISGEGTGPGSEETYTGKRTPRAIKSRLTRERCNGDRWASAVMYMYDNETGKTGMDLETGEMCSF